MTQPTEAPTVWLTTLGCAKNEVDSDKILGMLAAAGYATAQAPGSADVVMVNTCAFIEAARQESIDTILDLADHKREDASLVVVGCMAQRYESELAEALPEADAIIGLDRYPELVDRLDALRKWTPITIGPARRSHMDILYETRRPTPSTPWAYVKVAEGCDKMCTFCAIPQFRGKQRSRAPHNIRDEAAKLVGAGVAEIGLVAQDLAAYGRDTGDGDIVSLIRSVSAVDGLRRLRLFYLYPKEIRPALIEEMIGLVDAGPGFNPGPQVGLVVKGRQGGLQRGFTYIGGDAFQSDRAAETLDSAALRSLSGAGSELTFTVVPAGTETRIGTDRDEDGVLDRDELDACSDPANSASVPGLDVTVPTLLVGRSGTDVVLSWNGVGASWDVLLGNLDTLRSSGGDFMAATVACLVDDSPQPTLVAVDPAGPESVFFLVRAECAGGTTYESGGTGQVGLRDGEINASALSCSGS